MPDVNVTIGGIVLYGDESIVGIQLEHGYSFRKMYLNEIPFKDRITDGRGQLSINYLGSVMSDEDGQYFICIVKEDIYQVVPALQNKAVITDNDLRCEDQIEEYEAKEKEYLHMIFTLLHIFKEGNVGTKETFFEHTFSYGVLSNKVCHTSDEVTKNFTDTRKYVLSPSEIVLCNEFLIKYTGKPYEILKPSIDEFVWGIEQIHDATGVEQLTTALEMTLLGHDQQHKKDVLSKRISVLLESNPADIKNLYQSMKQYYRLRSDSIHEGIEQGITQQEFIALQAVVRKVMIKCLEFCSNELSGDSSVTWLEIKPKLINELKTRVTAQNQIGTFDD